MFADGAALHDSSRAKRSKASAAACVATQAAISVGEAARWTISGDVLKVRAPTRKIHRIVTATPTRNRTRFQFVFGACRMSLAASDFEDCAIFN